MIGLQPSHIHTLKGLSGIGVDGVSSDVNECDGGSGHADIVRPLQIRDIVLRKPYSDEIKIYEGDGRNGRAKIWGPLDKQFIMLSCPGGTDRSTSVRLRCLGTEYLP